LEVLVEGIEKAIGETLNKRSAQRGEGAEVTYPEEVERRHENDGQYRLANREFGSFSDCIISYFKRGVFPEA